MLSLFASSIAVKEAGGGGGMLPPEADAGGNTDVTLTAPMKARIIAFSKSTIDELAGCAVSSKAFAFSVTGVEKAAHYVAGLDEEGLEVTLKTSAGDVTVSLLEECHTGDMVMDWLEPLDFLPQCAQDRIAAEAAADAAETAPANADERAEFDREADEHIPEGGHPANKGDHNAKKHVSFTAKHATKGKAKGHYKAYRTNPPLGHFGDLTTKEEIEAHRIAPVTAEREHAFTSSLPANFNPFAGTPCLTDYTPRNQGSCGSCYAFAASTALALQACYVKSMHGADASNQPMYTVQGLVSCGKDRDYTGGCDGGSGTRTFQYIIDYGITTVGCWPYAQGGGDPLHHFDEHGHSTASCRSSCVPGSPNSEMLFTSGEGGDSPVTFDTEANVALAMKTYGALYCRFDVLDNFHGDGVYMGGDATNAKRGGHAVTCYGFGTTADGTKYWDCINSWGSGWGNNGNFKMLRDMTGSIRGLITSCAVTGIDYDDIFPAGSVPPSPPVFCTDRATAVTTSGMMCSDVGPYCASYDWIRAACPVTCGEPHCATEPPTWGPSAPAAPVVASPPAASPLPPFSPPPAPVASPGGSATTQICENTCSYKNDQDCDDGGAGSDYSCCSLGSDCGDCGSRTAPAPPPPYTGSGTCTNTCSYKNDQDCDDGGAGSDYSCCTLGTDCADCGARAASVAMKSLKPTSKMPKALHLEFLQKEKEHKAAKRAKAAKK